MEFRPREYFNFGLSPWATRNVGGVDGDKLERFGQPDQAAYGLEHLADRPGDSVRPAFLEFVSDTSDALGTEHRGKAGQRQRREHGDARLAFAGRFRKAC